MRDSVTRFQGTLGHLANISRLQQVHTELPEVVELTPLVEAIRLDLEPMLTAVNGQLTVDVEDCPTARFSPKNLRSVLYNLLSNAFKYAHPERPPRVDLRCHSVDGQTVLEVQDNGLGLTEPQQREVFVLFQRLHTHVDGTGVGLFMVKRLVENAGGTVEVQSQPGVGSTFHVSLPA